MTHTNNPTEEQANNTEQTSEEGLQFGIDKASSDGDYTALSIVKDGKVCVFTGEEAELLIAWKDAAVVESRKEDRIRARLPKVHLLRADRLSFCGAIAPTNYEPNYHSTTTKSGETSCEQCLRYKEKGQSDGTN